MAAYLGIDLGTSSVKCMAVSSEGAILALASAAYPSYSPHPGYTEQHPTDWIKAVCSAVRQCTAHGPSVEVRAIGFSGHMTSLVFLDREQKPIMPCMTIADTRCKAQAEYLLSHWRSSFEMRCGNQPLACFGVPRILWLKDNHPDLYQSVDQFVFAKDFVRGFLTGKWHTDPTDAGNSLLYDWNKETWDDELIAVLGINREMFPDVVPSTSISGTLTPEAAQEMGLPAGIPIVTGAADMACSQLGTGAFHEGRLVATIGTSGQVCINSPTIHPEGVGKITFHPGASSGTMYAMASIFTGGLAANWTYQLLFDKPTMKNDDFVQLASLNDEIAALPPGSDGVSFLPFLTGSGSPRFDPNERAAFVGLSAGVTKAQYLRAAMEGVAYNIRENVEVFKAMGLPIRSVCLGGGGTKLPVWRQIIADVLGCDVSLLDCADASTLGACMLAYAGIHEAQSLPALSDTWVHCTNVVHHESARCQRYQTLYQRYRQLADALIQWQQADKKDSKEQ